MSLLRSDFVSTADGVRLHCLAGGAGPTLLFVPGWSQTAAMFRPLLDDLARDHRVVAIDLRGHGESEKPGHGYRLSRLAADLHEVMGALDLSDVTLVGHSMGCAVIWSRLELFGAAGVRRLVLIDQAPVVASWPDWSEDERISCGASQSSQTLFEAVATIGGPDGAAATAAYLRESLFTPAFPAEQLAFVLAENLKFPRADAARLLLDLAVQDWRDAIRRIRLPTIVFGGRASIFHPTSQDWIARQIPGATCEIFAAEEGGGHFMWLENPGKFLRSLRAFLARS